MAAGRIRAFRTFGSYANLHASLTEFGESGGGIATALSSRSHSRIAAMASDIDSVQAVPFDRVVAKCLTVVGEPMRPVADEVQERETLARFAKHLPESSPFYACREFPGFIRSLARTMAELRDFRVSAERLRELSTRAEPWLAAKLDSLAALDSGLREGLRQGGRECESDRMERCLAARLPDGFKGRLWLYCGGEYSALVGDWVQWASNNGHDVYVVVDGHSRVPGLCHGADRMLDHIGAPGSFLGRTNALAEGLFADQPQLDIGLDVRVFSAGTPLAEAEWALRLLAEEAELGMPWKQGAIYARNLNDYAPLLVAASERFGIPLCLPRRERLHHNGWVRILTEFLSACADSSTLMLRNLARSSYLGLAPHTVSRQVDHILRSAASPDPWLSLRGRLDPADDADRWLFDAVRLHGKSELGPLRFIEWYDEVSELAEGSWLGSPLEVDSMTRQRDNAARNALFHALEPKAVLAQAFGDELDLLEFSRTLDSLSSQIDTSSPAGEEGIPVVSSAASLGNVDTLCVLGMVEGSFPRRRSEDPILSDAERAEIDLLQSDRPRLRNSHDVARTERDEFVRLCSAAGKRLCFFYPQVGDDRDNTPAFYLHEVKRVGGASVHLTDLPPSSLAPAAEECRLSADISLREALSQPKHYPAIPDLESEVARARIRGVPADGLRPRDLRSSLACPFQFVFSRRLGLWPDSQISIWRKLKRMPDQVQLANTATPEEARDALVRALEAELDSLGPDVGEADRHLLETGGLREIDALVEREFVSREIWRTGMSATSSGVSFGTAGTADELPARGTKIPIRGRFASVGDLGDVAVGLLYGGRSYGASAKSGSASLEKVEDPDFLELGAHLMALCRRRNSVALEIETGSERL
ncbi:MAG TPA: hypothetical protein PLX06_09955, partial [Fimbriimonadaceae bacterium]|nr:hypothetical protein [Fimbriimonadaceae bacterium]